MLYGLTVLTFRINSYRHQRSNTFVKFQNLIYLFKEFGLVGCTSCISEYTWLQNTFKPKLTSRYMTNGFLSYNNVDELKMLPFNFSWLSMIDSLFPSVNVSASDENCLWGGSLWTSWSILVVESSVSSSNPGISINNNASFDYPFWACLFNKHVEVCPYQQAACSHIFLILSTILFQWPIYSIHTMAYQIHIFPIYDQGHN